MSDTDHDAELLNRYRPVMQYDSHEPYFADFAAVISDHPGTTLHGAGGHVIATATDAQGLLGLLHTGAYPDAAGVAAVGDHLSEPAGDYQAQAAAMHARPGYGNRVHGRVAVDAAGTRWLQYWFIMYYDNPGILDIGVHEGDLEMIQLALGPDSRPVTAVYAHHRSGFRVAYGQVETQATADGPAPVVFSARGSHASMFRAGHQVAGTVVPDHNDGRGPRVRPEVIVLDQGVTPWVWWPGSWGGTRAPDAELGKLGVQANSPTAFPRHTAFTAPATFAASCSEPHLPPIGTEQPSTEPPPPAPAIDVRRVGDRLHVTFDASAAAAAGADRLTVATRPDGPGTPARVSTVSLAGAPTGTLELPAPADGVAEHEVHASARSADGPAGDTVSLTGGR